MKLCVNQASYHYDAAKAHGFRNISFTLETEGIMTILGPNLSLSLPAKILKRPVRIKFREKGAEVDARVQPNSFNMGLKKTPKQYCVPETTVIIKKPAASIT